MKKLTIQKSREGLFWFLLSWYDKMQLSVNMMKTKVIANQPKLKDGLNQKEEN